MVQIPLPVIHMIYENTGYLVYVHTTFHVSVNKKSNIDKLQRNTETIHIAYPTVVTLDSHPFVNIKEVTFQRSIYLLLCKVS